MPKTLDDLSLNPKKLRREFSKKIKVANQREIRQRNLGREYIAAFSNVISSNPQPSASAALANFYLTERPYRDAMGWEPRKHVEWERRGAAVKKEIARNKERERMALEQAQRQREKRARIRLRNGLRKIWQEQWSG